MALENDKDTNVGTLKIYRNTKTGEQFTEPPLATLKFENPSFEGCGWPDDKTYFVPWLIVTSWRLLMLTAWVFGCLVGWFAGRLL